MPCFGYDDPSDKNASFGAKAVEAMQEETDGVLRVREQPRAAWSTHESHQFSFSFGCSVGQNFRFVRRNTVFAEGVCINELSLLRLIPLFLRAVFWIL